MSKIVPDIHRLIETISSRQLYPFRQWIDYATLEIKGITNEQEQLKEALKQLSIEMYFASSKEGDHMSETLAIIKDKVDTIEGNVNALNVNLGKIETEMKFRFNAIEETLKTISSKLDNIPSKDYIQKEIQTPAATINTQLVEVKKDIEFLKTKSSDSVTNRKFWIGIAVSSVAAIVAIYKIVVG
ncbi:hypothetical protein [Paenibacillus sp. NEAU-GSW1]|uniref:hypothetical protein n=1 Tax=Paenibacillus sp. NEAU-GSW1 TaxID=2682486 RepID=UPI0012E16A1E|nr:hypothetical protein [Paenibacillus sp. NEAU-GSW1]MUT66003.1 hypothetical protein [Paenibacillus sp. NEAU-GSW1]